MYSQLTIDQVKIARAVDALRENHGNGQDARNAIAHSDDDQIDSRQWAKAERIYSKNYGTVH